MFKRGRKVLPYKSVKSCPTPGSVQAMVLKNPHVTYCTTYVVSMYVSLPLSQVQMGCPSVPC